MNRCAYCQAHIWPWQSRGWRILTSGVSHWHGECWRQRDERRPEALAAIYRDAREQENQWRIPQQLLTFVTPGLVLLSALLAYGNAGWAASAGAVGSVTATGAAILALRVGRWHRTAGEVAYRLRNENPLELASLVDDGR